MAHAPTPPMEGAARNYYAVEGTDHDKMRAEAYDHSVGDSRTKPQNVVVHYHKYDQSCEGRGHDNYPAKVSA